MSQEQIIIDAIKKERVRIAKSINLSIGLYGAFYPDIARALLDVLKDVDIEEYERTLAIYNEEMEKLNNRLSVRQSGE